MGFQMDLKLIIEKEKQKITNTFVLESLCGKSLLSGFSCGRTSHDMRPDGSCLCAQASLVGRGGWCHTLFLFGVFAFWL